MSRVETIKGPNAEQAEYWSTQGQSWIENEVTQDRILGPVSDFLTAHTGFKPGMRVLDIGCGTGAHALAVAERIVPGGEVFALDVSQPFLDRVAARATEMGQPVKTFYGDAQTADLPDGFDVATSRFGVMFFDDPAAAFANIAKALAPGGRMVFAAWGPVTVNPFWRLPIAAASSRLGTPPATPPHAPGPMGLADADYVEVQLEKAGLDGRVTAHEITLGHVGGPVAMANFSLRVGPASRIANLFEATEVDRAAIAEALAKAFSDYDSADGFRIPATLNIIEAQAR